MNKLLGFVVVLSSLFFMSCGDDVSDCTVQVFNQTINDGINSLNAAVDVFNQDPSEDNCNALRDAADDYLDLVRDLEGCPEVDPADFDTVLSQAQDSVNSINC